MAAKDKLKYHLATENFFQFLFNYLIVKFSKNKAKWKTKTKISFQKNTDPAVSIIIPVYNQWKYTQQLLHSIHEKTEFENYEIIIADDNSTDETLDIFNYFENIIYIKNEENLGFLRNCNNAAQKAKGKYILFLNNDTKVTKNWLKSLVETVKVDPQVGVVGAKLIYGRKVLQEAGGIVWKDGRTWKYGRLGTSDVCEYNYVKEVDYVSGACLLIAKKLWLSIGGFDLRFAPAYSEDTDLCFSAREKGYKVVYQPESVVYHYENISYTPSQHEHINRGKFYEKWKDVLEKESVPYMENIFFARERSKEKVIAIVVVSKIDSFLGEQMRMVEQNTDILKVIVLQKVNDLALVRKLEGSGKEVITGYNRAKKWVKKYKTELNNCKIFYKDEKSKAFINELFCPCDKNELKQESKMVLDSL